MALCVRILRARAEAEELVQEVVMELWRRAPEYDSRRAAVSTWVITIARSRALDSLRARQRRQTDQQVPAEEVVLHAPDAGRPDEQAAAGQRSAAVHRAMAALTPEQRQALELAFFEGLSHSEIAARLGQPLGTIKSRILSGMRVLRASMAGHAGEDGR
jgi:RNA polymerase sigma-70 factor (ECF subfamily)